MSHQSVGTASSLVVAVVLSLSAAAAAQEQVQVIVGFNGGIDEGLFASHGGAVRSKNAELRLVAGPMPAAQVAALRRDPQVAYIEPDAVARRCADVPNDPQYGSQWALPKINTLAAWDKSTGAGVRVCVLDTGINAGHPDLQGKIAVAKDFTILDGSADTAHDGDGHGTHVAGTVAAVTGNALGVASLARDSTLAVGKVLDDTGSGYYSEIVNGIVWAASAEAGSKVINMSLGGSFGSTALRNAVDAAWGQGLVICAAAGNSGNTRAIYPGSYTNCIAVAATDQNDARAYFSNYGSWVDCAAPGVSILSTTGGGYQSWNGTSMATPHVSALAALVWATPHASGGNAKVRSQVTGTGTTVTAGFKRTPTKRINAQAAVN